MRTKRSLQVTGAEAMQQDLRRFHHQVRLWLAQTPMHHTVHVALDNLNSAIILTYRQLNEELEAQRRGPRAPPP